MKDVPALLVLAAFPWVNDDLDVFLFSDPRTGCRTSLFHVSHRIAAVLSGTPGESRSLSFCRTNTTSDFSKPENPRANIPAGASETDIIGALSAWVEDVKKTEWANKPVFTPGVLTNNLDFDRGRQTVLSQPRPAEILVSPTRNSFRALSAQPPEAIVGRQPEAFLSGNWLHCQIPENCFKLFTTPSSNPAGWPAACTVAANMAGRKKT